MKSFLETLANDLFAKYGKNISDLILVFPNQRAGVFFNKFLSEHLDKPIWAPETTTINNLFLSEANISIADPLTLNFELYKEYKALTKSEESFDRFHYWGEMLLNDFDDIDKYLINAQDIFRNLQSIKAIEDSFSYLSEEQIEAIRQFWSAFNVENLSKHQQDFVQIWDVLYLLYTNFRSKIRAKGYGYEGMAYRHVSEKISNKEFCGFSSKRHVFIGFNALNACEIKLFSYMTNIGNADFYWDFDSYYLDDPMHEAGQFMRENLQRFTFTNKNHDHSNLLKKKQLTIISSPTKTGQAKLATSILGTIASNTANYSDTAVVLADENLLMPVLYSLPDTVRTANVTMGYPLKITPTYSFINAILELQKAEKNGRFYYKTVLEVIGHQFIANRFAEDAQKIRERITSYKAFFLAPKDLQEENELFSALFSIPNNEQLTEYVQTIIALVAQYFKENETNSSAHLLELESMFKSYTELNRISDILKEEHSAIEDRKTYLRIIRRVLNNLSVPFAGEPLSGLQILGVLETRLVDFKNLIILSLNEGIFPKGKPSPSFIPYNIRTGFGIPTVKHQDAIFSYYFYRLIQRAENVWFTYSTQTSENSKGELSRYLSQLIYSDKFAVNQQQAEFSVSAEPAQPICIEKNIDVQKQLAEYIAGYGHRKLSPLAINTFIDCPLRFYFRYIAKLPEPEQMAELLDDAQFGILYHTCMEKLYQPHIGNVLQKEDIEAIAKNTERIEQTLTEAFKETVFPARKSIEKTDIDGYNAIIFSVLKKYIENGLKHDALSSPITIHYLEHSMEATIAISSNGKTFSANLFGNADRIDETKNELRVIDYKTGKADNSVNGGQESLFVASTKRNRAALQTFLYAYLYGKNYQTPRAIVPAIFSIRSQFLQTEYHIGIKETPRKKNAQKISDFSEIADEFEFRLSACLADLFNKDIPFMQTEICLLCTNCAYKSICRRN